jgi:hypothetical protein
VVVPCQLVRVWSQERRVKGLAKRAVGTGPGMPRGLGCNLRPIYWWRNLYTLTVVPNGGQDQLGGRRKTCRFFQIPEPALQLSRCRLTRRWTSKPMCLSNPDPHTFDYANRFPDISDCVSVANSDKLLKTTFICPANVTIDSTLTSS